ncbi:hypothetical protein [Ilumatobacter sp.]|uniref:hypothetical protein n=1 Tax=Ilumatobacter sp. TaxID=1967498 RepID=UPI003AF546AE
MRWSLGIAAAVGIAAAYDGDTLVWSGSPVVGSSVELLFPVPGADDAVLLLDPEVRPDGVLAHHPFPNLVRVTPHGEIVWRVGPHGSDTWKSFVGATYSGALVAWGSAHRYTVDPVSGRIVEAQFVK